MNETIVLLIAELGVPAAVLILGFFIYWRESKKVDHPQDNTLDDVGIKLFLITDIKEPIIQEIRSWQKNQH
jgi:hypothetical protein